LAKSEILVRDNGKKRGKSMNVGDLVYVSDDHAMNGNNWRTGQTGFVVDVADFGSRIRVMIAGKTVWFFHFHLREL
jgi:hypothetical protein